MKSQSNLSLYWRCQIIGWAVVALYYEYVAYTGTDDFSMPLALLHFFTDALICIIITHSFREVSKRYSWQELSFQNLLVRLVPSCLLLGFLYMIFTLTKLYVVHSSFRPDFVQTFSAFYREYNVMMFIGGFRLMSIWLLAYYLFHYAQQKIKIIQENAKLLLIAKEAQLSNLSAQLNPHFLFNSLNSIKSLVVESPNESRRAVDLLSDLLRKSLYERDAMLISINDELAAVTDYLELEKLRFEERLQFVIDVPEHLRSFLIIPFSIQTLVENALKHGVNNQSEGGTICIKIGHENSFLCVSVQSPGTLKDNSLTHGLGLRNLQERLGLQFHGKASFNITEQKDKTVLATLMIPAA